MAINYELINKGGISLGTNFELLGEKPLDSRLVVPSLDGLAHLIAEKAAYAGMIIYVTSEEKHYQVNADGSYRQFGLTTEELNDIITDATTAAMEFKGATASLPASANKGDMYKVSASFEVAASMDAQGVGFTTKVGDSIVSDGTKWYIIPTGDDIEDTWRPITDVANDATLTFAAGDKLEKTVATDGTVTYKHEAVIAPEDKGAKWIDVTADGEGGVGTYKIVLSEDYINSDRHKATLNFQSGVYYPEDDVDVYERVDVMGSNATTGYNQVLSTADRETIHTVSNDYVYGETSEDYQSYLLIWNPEYITVYKQETARTYITGIETDGFGHITGYTTATENVEDTNTTYDFDCQVEHSNVYFKVKASDADQAQDICVDAYTRKEVNDKLDIKLAASGWKSNRNGDGWEYDWSIYKDDYGQPINYTNSSELNKDYLQFFKGQTQLDGNYNSWYPQTRVDAEGITIRLEDTVPHYSATMETKFTTDKIIHTVTPFDMEQPEETYTLSLPHTTDTLAVKGEVDAKLDAGDWTNIDNVITLTEVETNSETKLSLSDLAIYDGSDFSSVVVRPGAIELLQAGDSYTNYNVGGIYYAREVPNEEENFEAYIELPQKSGTLALTSDVDAVKEYADDTFLRTQCTLEHSEHAANWGTCNGFSGLQFSNNSSEEEGGHAVGPQCTIIGEYGLHIHDASYETYTTYGEGSISRRTAIWDENGQFAGNDSVQITLPETSGTIALQADVDAKLDAGNWSIEENGAAIFTTDNYGQHIELRAAGIDLYGGDEFNVEKAFLSTKSLSIHEGDNVTGYKAGKITNFTLDPENGPTEADLILPLKSGTIALTSELDDYLPRQCAQNHTQHRAEWGTGPQHSVQGLVFTTSYIDLDEDGEFESPFNEGAGGTSSSVINNVGLYIHAGEQERFENPWDDPYYGTDSGIYYRNGFIDRLAGNAGQSARLWLPMHSGSLITAGDIDGGISYNGETPTARDIEVTSDEVAGKVTITHKGYQSGTIMDTNHNNATDPSFITGITIQNGHVTGATVQNLKEVLQSLTVVLDGGTLKIG